VLASIDYHCYYMDYSHLGLTVADPPRPATAKKLYLYDY